LVGAGKETKKFSTEGNAKFSSEPIDLSRKHEKETAHVCGGVSPKEKYPKNPRGKGGGRGRTCKSSRYVPPRRSREIMQPEARRLNWISRGKTKKTLWLIVGNVKGLGWAMLGEKPPTLGAVHFTGGGAEPNPPDQKTRYWVWVWEWGNRYAVG